MKLVPLAVLVATQLVIPPTGAAQDPPPRPIPTPRAAIAPRPARPVETPRPPRPAQSPSGTLGETLEGFAWRKWDLEHEMDIAREEVWQAGQDLRFKMDLERDLMSGQWRGQQPLTGTLHGLALAPEARIATTIRPAWAPHDQGDSVYRQARELLNQGEYRRAAAAFRDITARTPTSTYAADALYWQAFALYRIGGTAELRSALEALDMQRSKYPGARMQTETDALSIRIRGALASRGDAAAAAQIRTTAGDSALRCDREEQAVRAEALNALTQSDPDGAMPVLQKVLARKDECSAMLRRTAVFLIGSKRKDVASVNVLSQVAKTDPSIEVRGSAMEWLARVPGEEALSTLEELSRDADERVSRTAVRALVMHPSPRARTYVRGIVERNETPERLRLETLSAFDKERSTSDDVTWMRALYGRTENPKIKARLVSTLSNIGGPEVDQWLLSVARNTDESSETRRSALRRVGKTLPIADLGKLYDASAERTIRETVIETLASRAEAEATDKLIDIVKTGTDPQVRRQAISALTRKSAKDPRTMRLLMEIIDK